MKACKMFLQRKDLLPENARSSRSELRKGRVRCGNNKFCVCGACSGVVGGGLDDFGHVTWQPDGKLTVSLRAAAALRRQHISKSSTGRSRVPETSTSTSTSTSTTAVAAAATTATGTGLSAPGEVRWPARGRMDLLLAMPSPRVLARVLPLVAAFGVDRLFLTGETCTHISCGTHVS